MGFLAFISVECVEHGLLFQFAELLNNNIEIYNQLHSQKTK